MEGKDLRLDEVKDLLRLRQEQKTAEYTDRDERHRDEISGQLMELKSLQEEEARIKKNIRKNLKGLLVQKHSLQKLIKEGPSEDAKLPITHNYKSDAIKFVTGAIDFIQNFPEIQESVVKEDKLDANKLCEEINACGESVSQELSRSKTLLEQAKSLRKNAEIIKNECFVRCDDDENDDDVME